MNEAELKGSAISEREKVFLEWWDGFDPLGISGMTRDAFMAGYDAALTIWLKTPLGLEPPK
jgi:hypothetical protein